MQEAERSARTQRAIDREAKDKSAKDKSARYESSTDPSAIKKCVGASRTVDHSDTEGPGINGSGIQDAGRPQRLAD